MEKEYIKYGAEWRRELGKHSKGGLSELFKINVDLYSTKEKMIEAIRARLIIDDFNKKYAVGSTVYWRPVANGTIDFQKMTVAMGAYISNGMPVCFFKERKGFCSIEPQFLEG